MEIRGRTALILGGSGLVGLAVLRRLLYHEPREIIVSALTQQEAEAAVDQFHREGVIPATTRLTPIGGDLFLPYSLRDRPLHEVIADPKTRKELLDDLYGEPDQDQLHRSTLGRVFLDHEPEIVVDCVNTATIVAYQNIFQSAAELRESDEEGAVPTDQVEKLLATLYLPRLIRHVQIALEAMKRVGTRVYIKIGTAGTGGMGLNIPFTHAEERPSRPLLAKAGVAGAHSLFLFLMSRTPGGPAVKEIKPTAAISWKRIAYGEIERRGRALPRYDATRALPLDEAFQPDLEPAFQAEDQKLEGVFLDAGENGLFSLGEFEALTSLGLMEFITPEEIALNVEREILGHPTGKDIVAALDAATSGPTYRAGVIREAALQTMQELEAKHQTEAIAYEMLGPPRLTKLLFEGAILARLFTDIDEAAELEPIETSARAAKLIDEDNDLRTRTLTAGLPILRPEGDHLLRGALVRVAPPDGNSFDPDYYAENGWVDLRPANWAQWRARLEALRDQSLRAPGAEWGSRADLEPPARVAELRPGRLAAWVFRYEDQGERIKR